MTLIPFFNADESQRGVTFYGAVGPWKHDSPNGIDVADLIEMGSFFRNLGGKRGAKSSSSGCTPRILAAIRHDNGLSAALILLGLWFAALVGLEWCEASKVVPGPCG